MEKLRAFMRIFCSLFLSLNFSHNFSLNFFTLSFFFLSFFLRQSLAVFHNMQSIFYFLAALSILAYVWLKRRYNFWASRNFLQGDAIFPFGSYSGIGSKYTTFEVYGKYYKRFKGKAKIVGLYSFFTPELMVIDPELIREILVKEFQHFSTRGMYYNKEDDPTSAK